MNNKCTEVIKGIGEIVDTIIYVQIIIIIPNNNNNHEYTGDFKPHTHVIGTSCNLY